MYRPSEMALLATERAAGPAPPRSAEDIRRDHPAAREVSTQGQRFDREAFEELYERDEEEEEEAVPRTGRCGSPRGGWRSGSDPAGQAHNPTASAGRGRLRRGRPDGAEVAGKPYPEYDDFWVTERVRTRRACALLRAAPCAARRSCTPPSPPRNIPDDGLSVVLFWRDAAKPFAQVLDAILAARARGLT